MIQHHTSLIPLDQQSTNKQMLIIEALCSLHLYFYDVSCVVAASDTPVSGSQSDLDGSVEN